MSASYAFGEIAKPPSRLRPISDRLAKILRPLWLAVMIVAIVMDVAGAFHVVRATYQYQPVFNRLGMDYEVQYRGEVWVGLAPGHGQPELGREARLISVDGQPVSADARIAEITNRLESAPGPTVAIDLRLPDGQIVHSDRLRTNFTIDATAKRDLDIRIATRLIFALLACAALLFCSLMLAIRRPRDPVAMLFAFAFAAMAATIDPPLQLWMAMGWALTNDVISTTWFYLLVLALATFPDGIFVPKGLRWLILAGIPLSIMLSVDAVPAMLQAFTGCIILLALLTGQIRRYRRLSDGIEKQQIKWAAFGFTTGFMLILVSFMVLAFTPESELERNPFISLIVLVLFSTGMTAIPLGLLVALIRFRLWEADTVITRSAAYAFVTMLVGIVWAASADLAKLIIASTLGQQHEAGATAIGAVIAVGVFGPTQAAVLGWTRRRFGTPADKLAELPGQAKEWSLTDSPNELGDRILVAIQGALHPASASLTLAAGGASTEIASLTQEPEGIGAEGPMVQLPLRQGDELIGTLILGPRSDGNRYGLKVREALQEIAEPLARALRTSAIRHDRESGMQQTIEAMAARIAQLEQGAPPKPA